MTGYTIDATEAVRTRYAAALATLPQTFAPGDTAAVLIDSHDPTWPDQLAAAAGGAGVLLVSEPTLTASPGLPSQDVPAVVDLPRSGSAVARNLSTLPIGDPGVVTAEFALGHNDDRTLADAAADALTVVARFFGVAPRFTSWRENAHAVTATGEVGGAVIRLSGVRCGAEPGSARVTVRRAARTVELIFAPPGAAWPGLIRITDMGGEHSEPSIYSDNRRASLLALATATNDTPTDDLLHYTRAAGAVKEYRSE